MKHEDIRTGQEVIWVRKSTWGPIQATVVAIYTCGVRIRFQPIPYRPYKEQDVSHKRLIPDLFGRMFGDRVCEALLHKSNTNGSIRFTKHPGACCIVCDLYRKEVFRVGSLAAKNGVDICSSCMGNN